MCSLTKINLFMFKVFTFQAVFYIKKKYIYFSSYYYTSNDHYCATANAESGCIALNLSLQANCDCQLRGVCLYTESMAPPKNASVQTCRWFTLALKSLFPKAPATKRRGKLSKWHAFNSMKAWLQNATGTFKLEHCKWQWPRILRCVCAWVTLTKWSLYSDCRTSAAWKISQ